MSIAVKSAVFMSADFIYLGFLRRFQHCTGHITTGSWKGRGNQYIQFVRVLYCKLPTNGKQLPAFPLEAVPGTEPQSLRWEASVTTLPPWPLYMSADLSIIMSADIIASLCSVHVNNFS